MEPPKEKNKSTKAVDEDDELLMMCGNEDLMKA